MQIHDESAGLGEWLLQQVECYRLELFNDTCRSCPWITELCMHASLFCLYFHK